MATKHGWLLGMAATVLAAGLVWTQPAAASEAGGVTPLTTMHVTVGGVNHDPAGFDISWVDNRSGLYFLADATNNAIDRFDARTDTFQGFIGQGEFNSSAPATCTANGASSAFDCNAPDGVVTDDQGRVWVGDGVSAGNPVSSIKVLEGTPGGRLIKSIPTGGRFRSDELSFDPRDGMILIANPDYQDAFLTWIDTRTLSVVGRFQYQKPASPSAWGGLEQSLWDPMTGLFYIAVPGVADSTGTVITPGHIDVFAPRPVGGTGVRVASFTVPQCLNGPVGLALGPAQHLIGACDTGAALVGLHNGSFEKLIPNVGGADEIWFNPGDRNVYLARLLPTLQGQLGVGDAVSGRFLQNLPTGLLAHSVAAYAGNNHIFVPVSGGGIQVFQSSGDPGS